MNRIFLLGGIICGNLFAANMPKPMIQSNTLDKEIFGRALIHGVGKEQISGTVEFRKSGDSVSVLSALGNGQVGEVFHIKLAEAGQCPKENIATPTTGTEIDVLNITENGIGNSEASVFASKIIDGKSNKIKSKSVLVSRQGSQLVVACGEVENTGQTTGKSPVKRLGE